MITPLTPEQATTLNAAIDTIRELSGGVQYYSQDGDCHIDTHDTEAEAQMIADANFDGAIDSESAEQCANVEYGVFVRIGGARETGEVKEVNGERVVMFEMEYGSDEWVRGQGG